jgi:hypothetical protein
MKTAAVRTLAADAAVELGTVVAEADGSYRVDTPRGEVRAELAASCLVTPSLGDRVLVACAGEEAYVLSLLRQASPGETAVTFPADAMLAAPNGKLRIQAGRGVELKTTHLRVLAEAFDTVAGRIYQRAVNFLRRTDELDRIEAKNIDQKAEQLMHHHAENAVTTADELVKIDGKQVHVG